MTDTELEQYLRENGYPESMVRAGKAGLTERWRKFVEAVEHGYKFGLEDYRNGLDLRGIIALAGLNADVLDLDQRFEVMLISRDTRVWESSPENPFWDFGYPKNAHSKLLQDLRAENLA